MNSRYSCTGNSRHINLGYLWIKDRVDNTEVRIEYLPYAARLLYEAISRKQI